MTNNVVTDDILYKYITFAGSDQLISTLNNELYWIGELNDGQYDETQFEYLKTKYT